MRTALPVVLLLFAVGHSRPATAARPPAAIVRPAVAISPILAEDPRLAAPVTLRLAKSPLSDVAAELDRRTGVVLTAAPEVADEPALVWMRERPAREVMHHLAVLFNYRWKRTRHKGDYRYELYQPQKSKEDEDALRQRDLREALAEIESKIRLARQLATQPPEMLEQQYLKMQAEWRAFFEGWDERSPAEKAALLESAPYQKIAPYRDTMWYRRKLQEPLPRVLARLAAQLTPEQWKRLLADRSLRFSSSPRPGAALLPAGLAAELRAAQPSTLLMTRSAIRESDRYYYQQLEGKLRDLWKQAERIELVVDLQGLPLDSGEPLLLKVNARPVSAAARAAARDTADEFNFTVSADKSQNADLPFEYEYPDEVPDSWKRDAVLGATRKLSIPAPQNPWGPRRSARGSGLGIRPCDLLPAIAETYGIDLVSDAYEHSRQGFLDNRVDHLPAGEQLPLYRVLNRHLARMSHWTRVGDVFRVRQHAWHQDRLREVPTRVADGWAERLRRNPQLSLDDMAYLVVAFQPYQLQTLEVMLEDRGVTLGEVLYSLCHGRDGKRELFRAYGGLTAAQRQALWSGVEVRFEQMPFASQDGLEAAFDTRQGQPDTYFDAGVLEGGALSLTAQSLTLNLSPSHRSLRVEYRAEAGADVGDLEALVEGEGHRLLVPHHVTRPTGQTFHLRFHYRRVDGTVERFDTVLPRAFVHIPAERPAQPERKP